MKKYLIYLMALIFCISIFYILKLNASDKNEQNLKSLIIECYNKNQEMYIMQGRETLKRAEKKDGISININKNNELILKKEKDIFILPLSRVRYASFGEDRSTFDLYIY